MRVLYWNINGIARDAAKNKLRELILDFKPDIFCLAEPKVHCTLRFLHKLYVAGYKKEVIHNVVDSSKGNIWIFWSIDIATPVVMNTSRQAITIATEGVLVSFVHASCFQVTRRSLWQQLSSVDINTPWQYGVHRILCKLDRALINEAWLIKYENWRCKALPREVSDHYTLIGFPFVTTRPKRAPFRVQKMWFAHSDFMRMVSDCWNAPVTGSPASIFPFKLKRLKVAMKDWNLHVFGNIFAKLKQAELTMEVALRISDEDPEDITKLNSAKEASVILQEIRSHHVTMLKQKSRNKWLLEGASNTSFFHANIRMRRSSNMISELVDDNGAVITDCNQIRDYTISFFESKFNGDELPIDEELFNYDHNIISVEDSQRMDEIPTMEEIKNAVFDLGADSAPGPDGFSGCFYRHCWDVVQYDLVRAITYCWQRQIIPHGANSSLIILLAKVRGANTLRNFRPIGLNVLSRNLTKLFAEKMMTPMLSKRGNMKSLHNLLALLGKYQSASGQTVCRQKSKIYYGGGSLSRCGTITNLLGMEVTTFPDRYLGVQIMPGAVKYRHICNVIEKIKNQLSVWKGKLLSFQDRVVLINSVIASYAIHNMAVYKWPRKFVQQAERVIRNFLWSGDADVARKFVVGYPKVCCPLKEGGLGITSMVVTNKALLMKLWWSIRSSNKKWARFLWAKFTTKQGSIKLYGVNSSILPGMKLIHSIVDKNTKVLIGDGRSTSLYFDVWYGNECIADMLNETDLDRNVKVSDIIVNNAWMLQGDHIQNLVRAGVDLTNLPLIQGGNDCRVWMPEMNGHFSVSSAKNIIRKAYPKSAIYGLLWRKEVHPKLAAQNWKICREVCATQDKIRSRFKVEMANKCYLCNMEEESLEHIIWSCTFATQIWQWCSGLFNLTPYYDIVNSYKSAKGRSRIVKDLWLLAILVIRSELWQTRNMACFQNSSVSIHFFKKRVFYLINEYAGRLKGFMHNTTTDLDLLNFFRVMHRKVKQVQPIECFWSPPNRDEILLCCDGAAKGNPGIAGAGVVVLEC
ncbi:uncharacterized protein LOC113296366 [Papaver somniferum]|uniref:uncharacterized protein LOC113296366 n=1 Tax=Papaver somniferum TaxID=3469 RepID=UPI000E6F58E6|nr:uncharacterized protein LOC113296366 [Papaver somniferum]